MATLKTVFNFYRFIFRLYLVDFQSSPTNSACGKVWSWLINAFLTSSLVLSIALVSLGLASYMYLDEGSSRKFVCLAYVGSNVTVSLIATLYLRAVSTRLSFGATLDAILKLSEGLNLSKATKASVNKYFYFSVIVFVVQSCVAGLASLLIVLVVQFIREFYILEGAQEMVVVVVALLYLPAVYFWFGIYFLTHSCLFFSILVSVLTDLTRPPTTPLSRPRNVRKYMALYEEVGRLAGEVNRMFSPLLLLAYASSVLGVSMVIVLSSTDYFFYILRKFAYAIVNVVASIMCLICILLCNRKRANYLKLVQFRISKRSEKASILTQLELNSWTMELLIGEEEWFNMGGFISVDESILLTVFQMIYDTSMSFHAFNADDIKSIFD